jgi:putative ABC transport system permease protein
VRERMHELGIRMALGASGGEAARIVLVKGMSLVAWGVLLGLAGGFLGARVICSRGWIPDLDPFDPATYAGVVLSLSIVAFAACTLPALRALRIDPAGVMRTE